jgi:hypothetical protein
MIIFVICFILVPLFLGAELLVLTESSTNKSIKDYLSAFTYLCGILTSVHELTDASVRTTGGKIIAGLLGLFSLMFIGFIASILITIFQLKMKQNSVYGFNDNKRKKGSESTS